MTKAWSHLPNATHIDWVIKTLKENPKVWSTARSAARYAAWCNISRSDAWSDALDAALGAARAAAWNAARAAAFDAARGTAWNTARNDVWDAACGATAALIVWDESSELLDKSVKEVKRLVKLEMPAAILLLPAVIVKNNLTNVRN